MDALDVALLFRMGLQPFAGPPRPPAKRRLPSIARELGVSADTAKERVARLEAQGVISGYEIFPNFRHLGVTATTYHFRLADPQRRSRAVEDVRHVDGVVGVFEFVGSTVCVDMAYRHSRDLDRKVQLVARLLGAEAVPHPCFDYSPPAVSHPLTHLDWRIVRALRGRAKRRPEDVAAELGVSARTVRRRLARMVAEGSVDIVPLVDTARLPGFLVYELLVTLKAPVASFADLPAELSRALSPFLLSAWPEPAPSSRRLTLLLLARSVAETEDRRAEAERLPGVEGAEVLILARSASRSEWVDEAIEARVRETAGVAGTPAPAPTS